MAIAMRFVRTLAAAALLAIVCCACAGERGAAPHASSAPRCGSAACSLSAEKKQALQRAAYQQFWRISNLADNAGVSLPQLRILGMDDGPVPGFEVRTHDGAAIHSSALVGREPFAVLFFATWCSFCADELRTVRRVLDRVGPVRIVPVSVDGPDTWPEVSAYLRKFGFDQPAVRAADYPMFALSYDPFDTVPLIVVVGSDGALVDYELGYDPAHERRLTAAVQLARGSERLSAR